MDKAERTAYEHELVILRKQLAQVTAERDDARRAAEQMGNATFELGQQLQVAREHRDELITATKRMAAELITAYREQERMERLLSTTYPSTQRDANGRQIPRLFTGWPPVAVRETSEGLEKP